MKKFSKLIPAFCMLLISAMLMGTSTFAWFSMNTQVTATGINDHLYEGRFTPRVNGKRISKNVYAKTREECEEKLKVLIAEMKKEIAEIKAGGKATNKGLPWRSALKNLP